MEVKGAELAGLGDYSSNDTALAVVRIKENLKPVIEKDKFVLMLDDLRDPGNFGTIIRTADWFGIQTIVASLETADAYNSKVIVSSMGSFTRVGVYYCDLEEYLSQNKLPVFGTFLKGEDAHTTDFGTGGILVIGNESNGISKGVEKFATRRVTIPRYGGAESLNAAIATAILCDVIRRA
jgi:TrmH family RNA methyltransferase